MDAEAVVVVAVMTATGAGIAWLGHHIRTTSDVTLVAGVRRNQVADEGGLARLVGGVTVGVGLATVALGLLHPLLSTAGRVVAWSVYTVGVLAVAWWTRRRGQRYAA